MRQRDNDLPKPTESELAILGVLWEHGPRTVREVHEALYRDEGAGPANHREAKALALGVGERELDRSPRSTRGHHRTPRMVVATLIRPGTARRSPSPSNRPSCRRETPR